MIELFVIHKLNFNSIVKFLIVREKYGRGLLKLNIKIQCLYNSPMKVSISDEDASNIVYRKIF